jgi:serine protease
MNMRLFPLFLLLASAVAQAQARPEVVPGEFVIGWRSEAVRWPIHRVAGRRVVHTRAVGAATWAYRLEERTTRATQEALVELARLPEVAYVEPNHIRRPFRVPNDPHYAVQWGLKSAKLEQAWDRTTGSSSIVVAVVDTGIRIGHPDLGGRLVQGYDFVSDPVSAGDGNERDADPTDAGTDALTSSGFHGMHVAGIIGATSNNNEGMTGVDWLCKIQPVRALGVSSGKGNDADIAAAIRWAAGLAVDNAPTNPTPARVINLSFGGVGYAQVLADAVSAAQKAGAIIVAAAGNDNQDAQDIYPAALPNVITVGAVNINGTRAQYSNFGKTVEIMAPGGQLDQNLPNPYQGKTWPAGIFSTLYRTDTNQWDYRVYEGTSQAAPLVSGVISLMLSINSKLNGTEAARILTTTANTSATCAQGCGAGLIDATKALAMTAGTPSPGTKLPFSSSCTGDEQCSEGVCQSVQGGSSKICTRYCSTPANCPSTACVNGLCAAASSACTGANCVSPGTIEGSCSLAPPGVPATRPWAALVLAVLAILGLLLRRS